MKLGTQTGSLTNHIMSRAVKGEPIPKVGMGATILCWTDRRGATIIEVTGDGPILTVQEDHAVRTDKNGLSECQTWEHKPNPNGAIRRFRQDKHGMWRERWWNAASKRWRRIEGGGVGLRIGERNHYHDFSF